jgi:hypothetical protein
MRADLDKLVRQASSESSKAVRALQGDHWSAFLADIDEVLPSAERALYLRWGARSGNVEGSGYGVLLVTTGRVLWNDSLNGATIRISDITEYSGGRGMSYPSSRNSYLKITSRGSDHTFYFEGDKIPHLKPRAQ